MVSAGFAVIGGLLLLFGLTWAWSEHRAGVKRAAEFEQWLADSSVGQDSEVFSFYDDQSNWELILRAEQRSVEYRETDFYQDRFLVVLEDGSSYIVGHMWRDNSVWIKSGPHDD